jgi:hypothetical protein
LKAVRVLSLHGAMAENLIHYKSNDFGLPQTGRHNRPAGLQGDVPVVNVMADGTDIRFLSGFRCRWL